MFQRPNVAYRCWSLVKNLRKFPSSSVSSCWYERKICTSSGGMMTIPKSPVTPKLKELLKERATDVEENGNFSSEQSKLSPLADPAFMEIKINESNSAQELLQISKMPTLLLKHSCLILSRLGTMAKNDKGLTFEQLQKDERFVNMCNLVQQGDYNHCPHLLFAAINGLERLGLLESADLYQHLNVELKWNIRRCPVRYLAKAISIFAPQKNSESTMKTSSAEISDIAIETLQRRWVEIATGSDFIQVFKIFKHLDNETMTKLEDRAVEMVQTFTPSEMRKLFCVIASLKRRPTPLLRALAFHFSKSEDSSNAKDLIELTYALNELTFADRVLMEKIFTSLCPEIPSVDNPALISSLATSLGQMRYKHKALLNILDEWILGHIGVLRPFDNAAWVLASAVLNHQTDYVKEFCKSAKVVLSPNISSSHVEGINIVHSFLVLNQHTNEMFSAVLSPEVIKYVDNMGVKSSKAKVKLLNINAVAKRQLKKGYKGPLLNKNFEAAWSSKELNSSDAKLSALALETMASFLPTEKYVILNQKLPCGVFIDAVCYITQTGDLVPILDANNSKGKYTPVAIVIEGYPSMTLGCKEATGQTFLNRNLLEQEGYKVIAIPYTEFSPSEKLVLRAKYLEQKIKSLTSQPKKV